MLKKRRTNADDRVLILKSKTRYDALQETSSLAIKKSDIIYIECDCGTTIIGYFEGNILGCDGDSWDVRALACSPHRLQAEALHWPGFVRVSRTHVVNMRWVKSFDEQSSQNVRTFTSVYITKNFQISVDDKYVQDVVKYFGKIID